MSAAVASSPAHGNPFDQGLDQPMEEELVEGQSYLESDRSVDISENQWREITKILKDVLPTMSPEEELGDLAAAEAAVNAKVAQRDAMVNKMRDELRILTRQHQDAAKAAQRPPTHPTPAQHSEQVRTLESKQVSLGKSLNEEQSTMTKREAELSRAKSDQEEIGAVDIGEDEHVDGKALRLKLLAEVGFTLVPPKEGESASKLLIRNDSKEDVHTFAVDKNRSRVYTANLLWSLASD